MKTKIIHAMCKLYWRLIKPRTYGVKIILFNRDFGGVCLVQHSYGSRWLVLPGGGVKRGEDPETAARRELYEELRVSVSDLRLLHTFVSQSEGKVDTVYLFTGQTSDSLVTDQKEIKSASFYNLSELPELTSPATRRRLEEFENGAYQEKW